jgi:hypothetical protein
LVKCENCGVDLKEGETYRHSGMVLCDDCYLEAAHPVKTCDPIAVHAALSTREQLGQKGAEGLTPLQTRILHALEQRGRATKEELAAAMGVAPADVEREFAILRHCELVRAHKEGSKVYITKW